MRKSIMLICALAGFLTANAQSFHFGYCNNEVATSSSWGGAGVGSTSAAIFIPAETLANWTGCEITTIRVGLATRLNIDELTVWVRASLDGENLAEGVLSRKQSRVQQGWNEVNLNNAYSISSTTGLYVGYSYHHTSLSRAVSVVGTTPEGTAFYQETGSSAWQDISGKGAVSVEAVISGAVLPQYDLSLGKVSVSRDLNQGLTSYRAKAEVTNMATHDVKGFSITLSGKDINDMTTHVNQTVESGRQASVVFSFNTQYPLSATQVLTATISSIDDADDENTANNSVEAEFAAFQRNVLLEEFTTDRCLNCPSGAARMNEALHSNADYEDCVSVVCHHSAFGTDGFTQPCDEDYLWFFNEGGQAYAPAWMINRQGRYEQNVAGTGEKQAIYWFTQSSELVGELDNELVLPTHLMLGAKAIADNATLKITILGVRDKDYSPPNGLLTVYVTEDNISGRQQSPDGIINPYLHQHVIRAYNSTWGDAINWEDDTFTETYTFALDKEWKLDDLKVVALVANHDAENNLNCAVENVTTALVETGKQEYPTVISSASVTHHPTTIYDLQGRMISHGYDESLNTPRKGILVVKRADGSYVKMISRY